MPTLDVSGLFNHSYEFTEPIWSTICRCYFNKQMLFSEFLCSIKISCLFVI